jgi:hypothetical protein
MVSNAAILKEAREESGSRRTLLARSPLYFRRSPKSTTSDLPSLEMS